MNTMQVSYRSRDKAEEVVKKDGGKKCVIAYFEFKRSLLRYYVVAPDSIQALTDELERQGSIRCNGV